MARFIIVRHGHTIGTEKNKYYGRTDLPLSLRGVLQIKEVKKHLGKIPIDYIYTSPLKRCARAAEMIKGKRPLKIETAYDLIEIDFGDWEGLTPNQMKKNNPKEFSKYLSNFENFNMPGGESVKNLIRRIKKFRKYILNKHKKGNILIVTHGGPAKIIIMDALGLSMKYFWRFSLGTASVSIIEIYNNKPVVKGIHVCKKLF